MRWRSGNAAVCKTAMRGFDSRPHLQKSLASSLKICYNDIMVDLSLIKPKDLWYTVGLIATDGNLSKDGRHVNITSKDKGLLEGLKKVLFLKLKLTRKSRGKEKIKKYFVLQIGDVKFYKFLLSIGLSQKKSLILGKVKFPQIYFKDFLRGVIDGDGNISMWKHKSNKNVQWSVRIFSASHDFVYWLKAEIENEFKVKGRLYKKESDKYNPLYTIKFGKLAGKVILEQCYYKNCMALNRKNSKALDCLKSENGLSKYGNVISI